VRTRSLRLAVVAGACIAGDALAADPGVEPAWSWVDVTASPSASTALSPREAELTAHCGAGDSALRDVARALVRRKERGLAALGLDGLTFAQRTAGEPHVWPRAWIASGEARSLEGAATLRKLDAWRASFRDVGARRCGVAVGTAPDGTAIIAAVAVDALADLAPLPTRAHVGAWLTLDARMLVPATGARVLLLGPGGEPRAMPASFEAGRIRARFALPRPGAFTLQVVADVALGPRPVLEAQIFADVDPPAKMPDFASTGEDAVAGESDADALTRGIAALRSAASLAPVARDARLDAIALAHARRMKATRTLGHDIGDGDPAARLLAANLVARDAGENVAHAETAQLAHRALTASPSHRANLLRPDFDRIGVAALRDPDGSVWVTEIFTSGLR
jgi:uncharacterized protein YkwD